MGNLNRTFERSTAGEFELRILFQMSINDSSALIDSPAAGRLGENRALYFNEEQGKTEKFRPYGLPDQAWLDRARDQLHAKPKPSGYSNAPLEPKASQSDDDDYDPPRSFSRIGRPTGRSSLSRSPRRPTYLTTSPSEAKPAPPGLPGSHQPPPDRPEDRPPYDDEDEPPPEKKALRTPGQRQRPGPATPSTSGRGFARRTVRPPLR